MLAMNYVEVNDPRGGEYFSLCLLLGETGHWLDFEGWDAESQLDEFFSFEDLGKSGLPSSGFWFSQVSSVSFKHWSPKRLRMQSVKYK